MTKEEAWKIINEHKDWNIEQKSISLVNDGIREYADNVYDAKRQAIKKAYETLAELDS